MYFIILPAPTCLTMCFTGNYRIMRASFVGSIFIPGMICDQCTAASIGSVTVFGIVGVKHHLVYETDIEDAILIAWDGIHRCKYYINRTKAIWQYFREW